MSWERTAQEAMMDITEGDAESAQNKIALASQKLDAEDVGVFFHREDAQRHLRNAARALFLSRTPFLAVGPAAEAESDAQVEIENAMQRMED